MITSLGFTGTRDGVSLERRGKLENFLIHFIRGINLKLTFHHGDCEGADEMAHNIALSLGYSIEIHPPTDDKFRAYCKGAFLIHPEKPYLARNDDIVGISDLLIATPRDFTVGSGKGGTWYTIQQARKKGISILFV